MYLYFKLFKFIHVTGVKPLLLKNNNFIKISLAEGFARISNSELVPEVGLETTFAFVYALGTYLSARLDFG